MSQEDVTTWFGAIAAACTSLSYIPQVRKAWPRGSTKDLSWKTLVVLTGGLVLWTAYGMMRADPIIIGANTVGALLSGIVLTCKVRDSRGAS